MAYYDYDEDRALIKGAFCSSFGMLPQEFEDLTYADYVDLFPSINGETTFAQIVRIRMETDSSRIKDFSKSEYAEWVKWQKRKKNFEDYINTKDKDKIEQRQKEKAEKLKIAEQRLKQLLEEHKQT